MKEQTYCWDVTYKEPVLVEQYAVISTHEEAITWFMPRQIFCLARDPSAVLELIPLFLISLRGDQIKNLTHTIIL
jgi:hypothetical protein